MEHSIETIRAFFYAVGVSLLAVTASAAATIAAQPSEMVAVVFPHRSEDGLAAIAAAARIVDTAWDGAIIIAVPDSVDFAGKAHAAGALALLPLPLGSGCLAPKR